MKPKRVDRKSKKSTMNHANKEKTDYEKFYKA